MKKQGLLFAAVLITLLFLPASMVTAQDKKQKQQTEEEILKEIDEQKKAMAEAKKAQKEAELEFKRQSDELQQQMKDIQIDMEAVGPEDAIRIYSNRRGGRTFSTGEPYVYAPGIEWYGLGHSGDSERTTWDFTRSVKESTFSRDYSFDVEKTVKNVVMSINGDSKSGEIRIKIVMPNGKTYSDIVIDEFGNLNWRKSFSISETENQDKTGEWKFQISSSKATGFFKISLQTF